MRVGVLVDSFVCSGICKEFIDLASKNPDFQIALIIKCNKPTGIKFKLQNVLYKIRREGLPRLVAKLMYRGVSRIESSLLRWFFEYRDFFESQDIRLAAGQTLELTPVFSRSGLVVHFTRADIELIRAHDLDVLVRMGAGILRGEILECCRHGVFSIHHGDNRVNRGGPPGFWEVLHRQSTTGFIIQRCTEELDGGKVLARGSVPTTALHTLNQVKVYRESLSALISVLRNCANDQLTYSEYSLPYAHKLYKTPSIAEVLSYFYILCTTQVPKLTRRLTLNKDKWGVFYQFSDRWENAVLWRASKLASQKGTFIADPFPLKRNGKYYIFVEEYRFRNAKGVIAVYEVSKYSSKYLGTALEESFHLSYPFLIRDGDSLYMLPEAAEAKSIFLYECINFPLEWRRVNTIMSDVSAVDVNIFYREDKWWLIGCFLSGEQCEFGSRMEIYYSDDLVNGAWVPHMKNPVSTEAKVARNGGHIELNKMPLRVAQSPGFDTYGYSCSIMEIEELTSATYKERYITTIEPKFFPRLRGTHTLSFSDGLLVGDYLE